MEPPRARSTRALLLALMALASIGAFIPEAYAWDLSVTPSSRTVAPGGSTYFDIVVTGTISNNPKVQLMCIPPAGWSISFQVNNRPAPFGSRMYVSVPSSAQQGLRQDLTVQANAGSQYKAKYVTVIVAAAQETWGLSVSPTSRTVSSAPGTAAFDIRVTGSIAGNPPVRLLFGVAGLGAFRPGASVSFSSNNRPAPFSSTMTISVGAGTPPGDYAITIYAEAAQYRKTATVHLIVGSAGEWSLLVDPASMQVAPGGQARFTISVIGRIQGDPTISFAAGNSYPGITFQFQPPTLPHAPGTTSLRVVVGPNVARGEYRLDIIAAPLAMPQKTATARLIVGEAQAGWDLSASPSSRTADRLRGPRTVQFTISVSGSIPGNPSVRLFYSNPPPGASISFSPNIGNLPFTSTMTISVDASAPTPPGDYSIEIEAVDNETHQYRKTTTVHLRVVEGEGPWQPAGWAISISPSSSAALPGGTASFAVSITGSSGGTPIRLIQSPPVPGIGASFSANDRPAPFSSTMAISVGPSVAPGTYRLQVWANPAGAPFPGPANKYANAYVVVLAPGQPPPPPPPEFDFSISAEPASGSLRAGGAAEFKVAISLVSGMAQPVSLGLEGLPDGASYAFDPASGTPAFASLLTISTVASVAPGTYALSITGEGGGLTRSASISLSIEAAGRPMGESSLSISASPASIRLGESLSVSGALSPPLAAGIKLVYRRPDGSELAKEVATSESGAFSDSLKPDMAGAWTVRAAWSGDSGHRGCESSPAYFSVLEAQPPRAKEFWEEIPGGLTGLMAMSLIALGIAIAALALKGRGPKPASEAAPPPETSAAARCPNCGAEYPEGSAFCPKCGEKV
ncbi:MAG: zinc ribbon domain-containing protein [Candidatus Bathyarchaeia archaeon]